MERKPGRTGLVVGLAGLSLVLLLLTLDRSSSSLLPRPDPPAAPAPRMDCRKQTNIVFVKTHKCASSTLQNIFLRFGEAHRLRFLLPATGHQLPGRFTYSAVPPRSDYNILAVHTRWSGPEALRAIPNAVTVTMLRDPVTQFESAWQYYRLTWVTVRRQPAPFY